MRFVYPAGFKALTLYLGPDTDNPSFPTPSKITDIESVPAPGFVSVVATDVKATETAITTKRRSKIQKLQN